MRPLRAAPAAAILLAASLPLLGCFDRSPTAVIHPPESPHVSLTLHCVVDVDALKTSCDFPTGAARGALYSAPVVEAVLTNESYSRTDSIYRADVKLVNRSDEDLGSPDGATVVGVYAFFSKGPVVHLYGSGTDTVEAQQPGVVGDTGVVRVRNADGRRNFTAPEQPYFHYDEIIPFFPTDESSIREWQWTVPPSVRQFGFTIQVYASRAGEGTLPPSPPDGWTIPVDTVAAILAPANLITHHSRVSGPYPRDLVIVAFAPSASADQKQAALDRVEGTLVGGDGAFYFFRVSSGTEPVWWAVDRLEGLPQVQVVQPYHTGYGPLYRRPIDGSGWQRADWQVHPDSSRGHNWAPESLGAPSAWGCETGNSDFPIAVVDHGATHAALVNAILASPGNNGSGMTGMMWASNTIVSDASGVPDVVGALLTAIDTAMSRRARVINLSVGMVFSDSAGSARLPSGSADSLRALQSATAWRRRLLVREARWSQKPLYVIAAGNYQLNAHWNALPQLATADSLSDRVIVVTGYDSTRVGTGRTLWADASDPVDRGSNFGPLVHVAAPASDLSVTVGSLTYSPRGTSFAAPHVTGIAGLLFASDTSRSSAEVRGYILAGATRGDRTAGGIPMANAYEALRSASEEVGAPLCGNRVWSAVGQIYARRGASTEALGPPETTHAPFEVEPLHGGKHIWYNTTAGRRVLEWTEGGTWQLGLLPPDYGARLAGTTNSFFGASHYADSVVNFSAGTVNDNEWWRTADELEVPVNLIAGSVGGELARIVIADLPIESKSICLERVEYDANNPAHPICTLTYNTSRWWMFRAAFPQAYQPVVVTVSPIYTTFSDSTGWRECEHDATRECRNVHSDRLEAGTKVYSIPLSGGSPTLISDLPGGPIFWVAQTEVVGRTVPADTVVLGRGAWVVERIFNPAQFRTTGNGYTLVTGEIDNCGIEYRALAGFALGTRIETTNVCNWEDLDFPSYGGGGTIAPTRSPGPATAGGGPPPSPAERRRVRSIHAAPPALMAEGRTQRR